MTKAQIETWRRLKKLPLARAGKLKIASGRHGDRSNGLCVMEAAAWVAGEPHSDHPKCVSPVIGTFLRRWNDDIKDDATRAQLMRPLLKVVIGTASTEAAEIKRASMCDDWMIRTFTPTWLDLAGLKAEAKALRDLPELTTTEAVIAAMPALREAQAKSAAASAALASTVTKLQKSASDLVRRMAAVKA